MQGDERDESLAEAFWGVARSLRVLSRESFARWDITPSQARALMTLRRHGPIRLSVLSDHLRIAARSATEVVDALQDRGLVERRPDPHDRRATLVRLTRTGTEIGNAVTASRTAEAETFFDGLSEADRAELARILRALRGSGPA